MNKIVLSGILAVAGLQASALAQWSFEMQLVPDTASGGINFPIGNPADVTATRVAFWLQARVTSTTSENWGIARASAPTAPDTSFMTITGGGATLARGAINAGGTSHGRGNGFRDGGTNGGSTGSLGGAAFPGVTGNNNGALDSGNTRIYGFDAYVGSIRASRLNDPLDPDSGQIQDPVTGQPLNPWNINGASSTGTAANPVPNQPLGAGVTSPWANLYRIWVDISDLTTTRDLVLTVHAQLNAGSHTQQTGSGSGSWPMQLSPGTTLDAPFTMHIVGVPTPGAAAVLGLGGLLAGRRRR